MARLFQFKMEPCASQAYAQVVESKEVQGLWLLTTMLPRSAWPAVRQSLALGAACSAAHSLVMQTMGYRR